MKRVKPLSLDAVTRAAELIRGNVIETPCTHSQTLSTITGATVYLKFENLQFTASFKERGALVKLLSLSARERRSGVIAMSAGNHAQGVAYHARRLGIHAVIVMPRFTPNIKVEHTRGFGAEVILHGRDFEEAKAFTETLASERKLCLIHPYDDAEVIAGQGTIALEMLRVVPDLEVLLVSVGGGGLISGVALAAQAINPAIEIVGVQAERFPSMHCALRGEPAVCGSGTIAEGIAVRQPGRLALELVKRHVRDVLLVGEGDIEDAVLMLLEIEKTVTEGAGAAGLACLLRYRERFARRKVGLILCGGNIDLLALSSIIQRGLVRRGRLVRLRVELRDIPGALAEVTRCIAEAEGNIVDVRHQRAFTALPLQSAEAEFVIQTRGTQHAEDILAAIKRGDFQASLPDRDAGLPWAL